MSLVLEPELFYREGSFHRGQRVVIANVSPAEELVRLPGRALLPGLVNAHSHAFQRRLRGAAETLQRTSGNFWTWREAMYGVAKKLNSDQLYDIARMAYLEMAQSGITTVGEFHYLHRQPDGTPYENPNLLSETMIRAARSVGLRICLLRVAYERAGFQKDPNPQQLRFIEPSAEEFIANTLSALSLTDGKTSWFGVAPHSVRAVSLPYLRVVARWAESRGVPVHVHVSEQSRENKECLAEYGLSPIALLEREGLLSERFTAVHAIHISAEDREALAEYGSTVCACPTTERNLGDGIVPAADLLSADVSVALGSDSQCQIDILEDARELEYHLRLSSFTRTLIEPSALFSCATTAGARSLRIPPGIQDYFTVTLHDPSIAGAPLDQLLATIVFGLSRTAVRDVIVDGHFILRDGEHPLAEEIVSRYIALQP